MIVAGSASPLLLASKAGGYNLTNSLRFRSSASAYLNRTCVTSNRRTFTQSFWIKRGTLGVNSRFFGTIYYGTDNIQYNLHFTSSNNFEIQGYNNGGYDLRLVTTQVFRDPSAWYHIVVAVDTTQATASNRVKLYVNGSQVTAFSTETYPTQNLQTIMNFANPIGIGAEYGSYDGVPTLFGSPIDAYLTEINYIDGQALAPSSFGETSATTGVWQPKKFVGTYGTNGFYLPFTDNSALTTSSNVGLGKDFSGNGNYWTTNNISITAGVTYDSMTDVPTLTSETASNYCVLNPLDKNTSASITVTNGNLTTTVDAVNLGVRGSMFVSSGKYYWEITVTTRGTSGLIGIADGAWELNYVGGSAGSYGYEKSGEKYNNGSNVAYGASWTTGDVIGVALNMDAGTLTFYKNNTSQGVAYSSLVGSFAPALSGNTGTVYNANFGQRPFLYTPPTGFVALNTFNLPTPTIGATATTQANEYFDATLYTGNGSTLAVTNASGFQPDFVWAKARSQANSHQLYDSVRGATKFLSSDTTSSETTYSGLTSFNSNGFTLGSGGGINSTGDTFVGWQWRASNATAVSNTAGSITSTVSANTSAGFSVVTYTGDGSNSATVGHGLGVAPKMVIYKVRSNSIRNWIVYHASLGNTLKLELNTYQGAIAENGNFGGLSPTSTTFGVGYAATNGSSETFVAYCFAEVAGYSKISSYTANGSSDGPFVYCGFKPKYILWKNAGPSFNGWQIEDTSRSPINAVFQTLRADTSDAEESASVNSVDFLSNGFKIRGTSAGINQSGQPITFIAFAESPFKYANAR